MIVNWSLFDAMFPTYDRYRIPMWSENDETDSELTIELAVPGFEKEDFDLYVKGERLLLEINSKKKQMLYSILHRSAGVEYVIEEATAEYKNGILKVTIPKLVKKVLKEQKKLAIKVS